jgi:hypothetical protein
MKTSDSIEFSSTKGIFSILNQLKCPENGSEKLFKHKSTLRRLEFLAFTLEKVNQAISEKNFGIAARLQEIHDFYSAPEFLVHLSSKGYHLWKQEFFENYFLHIYILLLNFERGPIFDTENEIQINWKEQDWPRLSTLVTLFKLDEVFCSWNKRQALRDHYIKLLQQHGDIKEVTFKLDDFRDKLAVIQSRCTDLLLIIFNGWDHSSETIKESYDLFCEYEFEGTVAIKVRDEPEAIVTVLYN